MPVKRGGEIAGAQRRPGRVWPVVSVLVLAAGLVMIPHGAQHLLGADDIRMPQPGNLQRRRPEIGKRDAFAPCAVPGEVHEDVHAVLAHALGKLIVAQARARVPEVGQVPHAPGVR